MKKKKEALTKIGTMEFYTKWAVNTIKDGIKDEIKAIGDRELQIAYSKVYSKNCIKSFYFIKSFTSEIDDEFMESIRSCCAIQGINYNNSQNLWPHVTDWTSDEMKSKRDYWEKELEDTTPENGKLLKSHAERKLSWRRKWLRESWKYKIDAEERECKEFSGDFVIEICAESNNYIALRNLKKACYNLETFAAKRGITVKKVKNYMYDFLKYSGPLYTETTDIMQRIISMRVLTDEILVSFNGIDCGKAAGTQVLMGMNTSNGQAYYHDFADAFGGNQSMLISAGAGSGKSLAMKVLNVNLLGARFHTIVMDKDGEYRSEAEGVGGVIVDLDLSSGWYFDTMQIGDLTGIGAIDRELFEDARRETISIFHALASPINGMSNTELKIFSDAYDEILTEFMIYKDDRQSWSNSHELCYRLIYTKIVQFERDEKYLTNGKDRTNGDLSRFVDRLSIFFEQGAIYAGMFQHKLSIKDIIFRKKDQTRFIDIIMHINETGGSDRNDVEDVVKIQTAAHIMTICANYFRAMHEFTANIIEEYARYRKAGAIRATVMDKVTGDRKRNAFTVIVTNNPAELLESDDGLSRALVDNVTNFLLGSLSEKSIASVCKGFGLENCEKALRTIANPGGKFKHCFLFRGSDGDCAIIKQIISKDLVDSPIFKTRDTSLT